MDVAVLTLIVCVLLTVQDVRGIQEYFLAAIEVDWDYAPSGASKVKDTANKAKNFLELSANRSGRIYRKAIYRQYTDKTFSEQVPGPGWLGMVGPILKGEVGERIIVHFKNFATKHYSVHPHGLHYAKHHEGALYLDETSGSEKRDDVVPPGGEYTYEWDIIPEFGPTKDDADCIPWVYHSHGPNVPKDTNTGLIGVLLTCKKGSLDKAGNRKDVNREFVALLKNFDENGSWYTRDNYNRCQVAALCQGLALERDHDFMESNIMHSLNGYLYGNGPSFEACVGDKVAWYVIGMGSEADIHSFVVDGETMKINNHRRQAVGVFATSFVSAEMVLFQKGKKLAYCDTTTHFDDGMIAFLDVKQCGAPVKSYKTSGVTRNHFLSIEEVVWDYAPSGINQLTTESLIKTGSIESIHYQGRADRIGSQYIKALYYGYTDSTFTQGKSRPWEESHLGSLGPTIRVEVGDILEVVLFNNATRPFSFLPRGLIPYGDQIANGSILTQPTAPKDKRMYRFFVSEESAPGSSDPACITFMYHSAMDIVRDVYSGLVGPLIVCRKGSLDHEEKQKAVTRELKLFLSETDENKSWYIEKNINKFCISKQVNVKDPLFTESNIMRSINGYGYANLQGLSICKSEQVAWHLFSVGSHTGVHSLYFHDLDFLNDGSRQDTVPLFPGSSFTFITKARNIGRWEIVCRNIQHYNGGMTAFYDVRECGFHETKTISQNATVKRRRFFIGAVEREWNYVPTFTGLIMGSDLTDPRSHAYRFVNNETGYIGTKYIKALFREFTDSSFRFEKQRPPEDEHLGIMGPAIKAEVGDEIEVVFKNMASKPFSMHAHLINTDKANEGSLYSDDANTKSDDEVQPNGLMVYKWHVPTGPGPKDPSCISSLYYSAHDEVRDLFSGLVGPIIICKKGVLDESGRRTDVDKEFSVLFSIFDENESLYLSENIRLYAPARNKSNLKEETFVESNLMHAINGYIFQAVPGLTMTVGEKVAWYILGFGSTEDLHTVHFHGQTVLYEHSGQHTQDVLDIFPESGATTEMLAINPGVWLLHCHVDDHMAAGMETIYTILPKGSHAFIANISVNWDGKSIERVGGRVIVGKSFPTDETVNETTTIISVNGNKTKGNEYATSGRFDDSTKGDNSKLLLLKNIINNTLLNEVNSKSHKINLTQISDIQLIDNVSPKTNADNISPKTNLANKSPKTNATHFVSDETKSSQTYINSSDINQSSIKSSSSTGHVSEPLHVDSSSEVNTLTHVEDKPDAHVTMNVSSINLLSNEISYSQNLNVSPRIISVTKRLNLTSKVEMVTERTKLPEADDTMTIQGQGRVRTILTEQVVSSVESSVVNATSVTNSFQRNRSRRRLRAYLPPM